MHLFDPATGENLTHGHGTTTSTTPTEPSSGSDESSDAGTAAGSGTTATSGDTDTQYQSRLSPRVHWNMITQVPFVEASWLTSRQRLAAGLGPLRAAVTTHIGPDWPGGRGPARMLDPDGVRHPLAKFTHLINVYLNSAFAVTQVIAKNEPLASNQRGVIINTASIASFEGQPGQAAYSAAKGGIIGITLTIARDLAEHGIRVMAIAPGPFFTLAFAGTASVAGMTTEQAQEQWGSTVPKPKRIGDPDEYAILAAQIVENDYPNGTTIRLDGALRR